jgi:hypothetical protein
MDPVVFLNGIAWYFHLFAKSPFFRTLEFLLAIYAFIILADIVMLVISRGFADIRFTFKGMKIPMISPKKMKKKWDKIEARIKSNDLSNYKLAVIEADKIVGDILIGMSLEGGDLNEILDNLKPGQIENLEDLKKAHKLRNQIIHDPSFEVSKESAAEIIGIYEEFLKYFQFLEG